MKRKFFYMLALICCMSFFSSAKQSGNYCDKRSHCVLSNQSCPEQARPKPIGGTGFVMSPLQLFEFGI